ncbi:MAG: hypothetical protein H8M99_11655 [Gloeobacteraceae cyanobacterium ES-bin-144]|nr:hypothetical protein [Verrucomicrobiales bacterium]
MTTHRAILLAATISLIGCATDTSNPVTRSAVSHSLHAARAKHISAEQRAALYLQAIAEVMKQPGSLAARDTYNAATAELTMLLRSAEGGQLWNRPLNVTLNGTIYQLSFAPASRQNSTWDPGYFDSIETPVQTDEKRLKLQDIDAGYGAPLVGIHKSADPKKDFFPTEGIAAPITAIVEFSAHSNVVHTRKASLSLHDPTRRETVMLAGKSRPLAADFTAPLAFYPNSRLLGFKEAMRVDRYFDTASLTMLQPYDPERIPVVFVHGLMSQPGMWENTINAVESDPVLRGKFQFWTYGYPTGAPISISALQLRESLAGVYQRYPKTKDMVLVSHSLGGLLSKMQTTRSGRKAWDAAFGAESDEIYQKVSNESIVKKALIFEPNPHIKRVVFVCVPHRGSPLADNYIGAIGISLIHMPMQIMDRIQAQIGESLVNVMNNKGEAFPPSVHGLSQKSPLLHALDTCPIEVPHHTIAGDRGKGNSPHSTDGVVPYHSSHLPSAQSEVMVPGPHSSCGLPQTTQEISRILHLHLKTTGY